MTHVSTVSASSFTSGEPIKKSAANISIEMRQLFAMFTKLYPQMGAWERDSSTGLETNHRKLSSTSADCRRTVGDINLWVTVATSVMQIAFAIFCRSQSENVLKVGNDIIGRIPQGATIGTLHLEAKQSVLDAEASRIIAKLSDPSNNKSREVLNAALEANRKVDDYVAAASRAG